MISGVILWAVISLVLIILTHNIYIFFKDTLTVPKVKDFINEPNNIYKEIEETLKKDREKKEYKNITDLNKNELKEEMKDELKNFFKELNTEKNISLGNYSNYVSSQF